MEPLRAALPSVLVALDFEGTLAPISPHPDSARPLPGTLRVLKRLRATGATVAIITSRTVPSLLHVSGFGTVPGIVVYGTHGAERWRGGELRTATAPSSMVALRPRPPSLLARLVRDPAIWIEDKGLSLVIHTRITSDPDRVLTILRDPVKEVAADAGLETRPGKEVLEICIPGIDKGTAIRELLGSAPEAAFYAGDDTGDLPALCGEEVPGSGALPGSGTAAVVDLEAPFPGPVAHLLVPAASR